MPFLSLDLSRLSSEPWFVPVIGMLTAGLTLAAGLGLVRRRRNQPEVVEETPPDPFLQGSASERRSTVRRKGNHVEVVVNNAEASEEGMRGWVIDRSMGGLCLLFQQPMPVGTIVSLKPRQCPPGTPWVRVEVRTCKEEKGGFEMGCKFQRTPPWSIMLLFG